MSSAHLDRLREAMQPDPARWSFTGTVNDTGSAEGSTCACGQAIRYEFVIKRPDDAATLVIGSQCIETSVPYLIEVGAARLADALDAANQDHQRRLRAAQREARDERARAALGPAREDLRGLMRWFDEGQRGCRAEAAKRGEKLVYFADDIKNTPHLPADSATPGRTLASTRRRFTSGWLRGVRHAHENGGPLPPLPTEPGLRESVRKQVTERVEKEHDVFHEACRFARLAYHGDAQALAKVPKSVENRAREGYAVRRRQRQPAQREPAATLNGRHPRLDQLLARDEAVTPDADQRWRQFEAARSRPRTG